MNLADLTGRVLPDVPGCPEPVIESSLQRAAVRFFRDSWVWREVLPGITLVSGQSTYTPSVPTDSRLERVLRAQYGNIPLDHAPHEDLILTNDTGAPVAIAMDYSNDLVLYPTPDDSANKGVTVYGHLVPLRDATTVPDRLGEEWEDALVAYAKTDILDTPQKPWTDPRAAQYQRQLYQRELARAKVEAIGGHGANRQVKHQRFGP